MPSVEIILPTGFAVDNEWYRASSLRPINGADEDAIGQMAPGYPPVERDTMILTRCLTGLGPKSPVCADDVRALTAGDRDALLLHLRRLTFGEKIRSVLTCPDRECGEKMELEFQIDDILVPPNPHAKSSYEMEITDGDTSYNIKFRLPTGADLEMASIAIHRKPDDALKTILRRCVEEIKMNGRTESIPGELPQKVVNALSARMGELDAQAEIKFNLTCPACEHQFQANFEIGDFLYREILSDSKQLYREVHSLALHYHWSEQEIIRMGRAKRKIYLRLLAAALNQEGS